VRNNQDSQIHNITLCNMYFSKKVYEVYSGVESGAKPPEAGEFSRIFLLKVTLQSVRLLLTISYRKMGEQDTLLALPIILLGSCSRFPRLCHIVQSYIV